MFYIRITDETSLTTQNYRNSARMYFVRRNDSGDKWMAYHKTDDTLCTTRRMYIVLNDIKVIADSSFEYTADWNN